MRRLLGIAALLGLMLIPAPAAAPAAKGGCAPGQWCEKTVQAANFDRVDCDGGVTCTWDPRDNGNLRITAHRARSHTYYVVNTPGALNGLPIGGSGRITIKKWFVTDASFENCREGWAVASVSLTGPGKSTIHLDFNRDQKPNQKCVVSHFVLRWRSAQ